MTRKRIVMMIAGLLVAAVAIAQEMVIRDRGGDVARVTNNALDVNAVSGGINLASEANLDDVEADLETAVTHLSAIETAVEDATARDVTPIADTTGGCTYSSTISAATVNETAVKATAGQIYSVEAFSLDATPVYWKFYNDTAANIDETDTPVLRLMIPANSTASLGAGIVQKWPVGIQFSTAITFRATVGIADNDTAALTANEVLLNVCYK